MVQNWRRTKQDGETPEDRASERGGGEGVNGDGPPITMEFEPVWKGGEAIQCRSRLPVAANQAGRETSKDTNCCCLQCGSAETTDDTLYIFVICSVFTGRQAVRLRQCFATAAAPPPATPSLAACSTAVLRLPRRRWRHTRTSQRRASCRR